MANVTVWNPFKSVARLEPRSPLFDDLFREFGLRPRWQEPESPKMRIDVTENDGAYSVKAEIPGAAKDDIDVCIDGNQVSVGVEVKRESKKKDDERDVYTERYYGQVYRSFTLPIEVDSDKASAQYEHGVLTLTLPKMGNGSVRKVTVS